ncbi:MAG: PocR ligand-binding domain-containing protein [Candidatus Omnitrophica bacterium]|nr:PocR ligand-binding domain-containing protein [Candidatus Omnitrophota bacterium]
MKPEELKKLAREVIDKEKWWDMLSHFIDVLRVNIFVIDAEGRTILPPERGRYGGRLLTDQSLKFDLADDSINVDKQFDQYGAFFESYNRYGLNSFAIPIKIEDDQIIAYMVMGPVILNKRLSASEYEEIAEGYGCDKRELFNELGGIRVVSNIMVNSILDLLSEIIRDNVELSLRKRELNKMKSDMGVLSEEFSETAQEIYSAVYLDGLLATLLDVALKMTNAECGSIMVKDPDEEELTIKASRGLDPQKVHGVKVKMGEGVAGVAAQENAAFVIHGTEGDNRIKQFLKRPEIKEALVMPLQDKDRVFGVLSLHTKREEGKIEGNLNNLQYLSKLLSSAL